MTLSRTLSPLLIGMCVALAAVLTGCSSSSRTVTGLVVTGKASVVTLVAANDPRLEGTGVGDVRIRLTRGGGTPASLAETTSNPDGSFSFKVSDQLFRGRIELIATGPTMLPCRGSIYLPTDDRRILVIVEPIDPSGVGSAGVGEQTR